MKKLLLITVIGSALALASCKPEVVDPPAPGPTCTLTKIINPDGSYSVIARTTAGKYASVKNYPPSGTFSSWTEYVYSGDRVSKMAFYKGASDLQYYYAFEKTSYGELIHIQVPAGGIFNEQGQMEYYMSGSRITKVVSKANSQGNFVPVMEDLYTFDGNGNVTKVVSTNLQNSSSTTTTYTYDAKKKPYVGDFSPAAAVQSTNNVTSMTSSGGTSETYTVTYNGTGYMATRSTVGNGKSTYTFEYTGCN